MSVACTREAVVFFLFCLYLLGRLPRCVPLLAARTKQSSCILLDCWLLPVMYVHVDAWCTTSVVATEVVLVCVLVEPRGMCGGLPTSTVVALSSNPCSCFFARVCVRRLSMKGEGVDLIFSSAAKIRHRPSFEAFLGDLWTPKQRDTPASCRPPSK